MSIGRPWEQLISEELFIPLGMTSCGFGAQAAPSRGTFGFFLASSIYFFCCVVLCCFVLFCFVLFCFVLFCFVLFCFVLFCFVLFCFVLFCFVLFCFVLFCFVVPFINLFTFRSTSTVAAQGGP